MKISQLLNKHICILGFGREGQSTYRWLIDNQITDRITIADDVGVSHGEDSRVIAFHDEGQWRDHLDEYDVIIRTAGISPHQDALQDHQDKITSQTQVFFDNYEGVTIAVTGTKGKSTTSTLIHRILAHAGFASLLVGNIGDPVLSEVDLIDQSQNPDYVVYELSSFQLTRVSINPTFALITNLLEDHLDRHGSREHYYGAKRNIIGLDTVLIAHASTVDFLDHPAIFAGSGTEYDFDERMFATPDRHYPADIQLPGQHNRENICLINALMCQLHITPDYIYQSIRNFDGLPHRLQLISTKHSIRRIDDSQSTNPSTCITALQTYGSEISSIMLGGYQSHFDYAPVIDMIRRYPNIQTLILFPDTIDDFRRHITDEDARDVFDAMSMQQAVDLAREYTPPGQICLLSPGAKSFSLWTSMSERGNEFLQEINDHL